MLASSPPLQGRRLMKFVLVLIAFALATLPSLARAACPLQEGVLVARATYYNLPGKQMANGRKFDPKNSAMAATPKNFFPLGTVLLVTNPSTNKSIIVHVTDRMPEIQGWRMPPKTQHITTKQRLDLTPRGADILGFYPTQGVACVEVRPLRG